MPIAGRRVVSLAFVALCWMWPRAADAQQPQASEHAPKDQSKGTGQLAQAAQNPISSLISVPFQLNFNGDIGEFHRTQTVINLQPVIPVPLTERVTLALVHGRSGRRW
jgi:hypothetical protein